MCKELFTSTGYVCGCVERDFESTKCWPDDCRNCGVILQRVCISERRYPFPCTRCVSRYDWNVDERGVWSCKKKPPAIV